MSTGTDGLRQAGLANIAAFDKASLGRRGRATLDEGGVALCAGSTPAAGPWTNSAVRVDPALPAAEALDRARDFFGPLGHGFAFWTDDALDRDLGELLRAHDAQPHDEAPLPGMVVTDPVDTPRHSGAVQRVSDATSLDDFCEIVGIAYGFGSGIRGILGGWPPAPNVAAYLLRMGGQVRATAMGVRDIVGGVYMVGTPPEHRRHGYGEAVTAITTNDLFAEGADAVVLQASAMGEPIYRRMGYRTFTTYHRWALPA